MIEAGQISIGNKTMRFKYFPKGNRPERGYALVFGLHGGGKCCVDKEIEVRYMTTSKTQKNNNNSNEKEQSNLQNIMERGGQGVEDKIA